MNPPNTRKGALGFLRGCDDENAGSETVAQIRVSLPTFPQLVDGQKKGDIFPRIVYTHVSLTPARLGHSWASSVITSESKSIPPLAPGSLRQKLEPVDTENIEDAQL